MNKDADSKRKLAKQAIEKASMLVQASTPKQAIALARKFGLPSDKLAAIERLTQLLKVDRFLKKHNAPEELHVIMLDLASDIVAAVDRPAGRKPRRMPYRYALATLAAAVTALTKSRRGVDAAIAEIAVRHDLARKELKDFRDRLIRKKVDVYSRHIYERALTNFARKSRAEIFASLKEIYVPNLS